MSSAKTLTGPYINGAWMNKPGETIFLCVSCGNNRDLPKENAFMYDELPGIDLIQCHDCGETVRDRQ